MSFTVEKVSALEMSGCICFLLGLECSFPLIVSWTTHSSLASPSTCHI